jgi:sodium/bile acid cotransporter 7
MIKRLLLPVGLLAALAGALAFPGAGLWISGHRTTSGIIAAVFLINGYQTELSSFVLSRRLAGAFVIAALVSFVGGGILGKMLVSLLPFDREIAMGILVMSTMAPTLSSVIVITRESGGNSPWAILMTVGLNLLAIFAIPLLLTLLLSGSSVSLPIGSLLGELILNVLAPFVVGVALRRAIRRAPSAGVNLLPTLLVIALSYMSFCSGRRTLMESSLSTLALLAASLLGMHLVMLALAAGLSFLFGYRTPERKAISFLSSQKTLPTAIGILASLGYASGAAALPCVMFHFTQILADSIIAGIWRSRISSPDITLEALPEPEES